MKKVLIVSPDILPVPAVKGGAVETLVEQLIISRELSSSNEIDYTVISIADGLITDNPIYNNDCYVYFCNGLIYRKLSAIFKRIVGFFGFNKFFGDIYLLKVCNYLRKNRFDFIIVENKPEYGLVLKKFTKSKVILHLHNDRLSKNTDNAVNITSAYHAIFTVSKYVRENVLTIPTVNAKNVKVIYNCVDLNKYESSQRDKYDGRSGLINRYKLCSKTKIITYIGRLDKSKGVLELIQAFNRIKDHNLTLLIVGASWYSEKTKNPFVLQLEKELINSVNSIVFTGYVEHSDIPFYQMNSDILVVPSVSVDACPLVVLESMAANVPLISTDSGGIPELVGSGCGILVERENGGEHLVNELYFALENLLDNPKLSDSLVLNASRHVKHFDIKSYSNKFEIAFKDID